MALESLKHLVMPGLDPGIQSHKRSVEILDRRVKPGDDNRRMRKALGVAILALIGVAAPQPALATPPLSDLFERSADYDFEPPLPGSYALPPLKSAPDGSVIDHEGAARQLADILEGRISLVSFVYLMCSDEMGCPLALSTLFALYEASEKAPERLRGRDVQLVTLSFDPARDTPEAINAFAYPMMHDSQASQKLNWRVLTTPDEAALKPLLAGFGQVINRKDADVINHLLRMYLVDRDGKIRNIYGLGMIDPRLLMTDIETLLMEEEAR